MGKRRRFRFMVGAPLSGFRVRRVKGLIFVAGVIGGCRCETGRKGAAKSAVCGSNGSQAETTAAVTLRGCLIVKLNPNPLADNLAQFPKARCLVVKQVQDLRCGKSPVLESESEINLMQLF